MWGTLTDHLQVVYGAVSALALVVLLTPAVGGFARRVGAVDEPDGRRVHVLPVPRLGGLALFIAIFVPALAFLELTPPIRGLLIGAAAATAVAANDALRGLQWWQKPGGQVGAASIAVGFGVWIDRFTFPFVGIHTLPEWLRAPPAPPWVAALKQKVNLLARHA